MIISNINVLTRKEYLFLSEKDSMDLKKYMHIMTLWTDADKAKYSEEALRGAFKILDTVRSFFVSSKSLNCFLLLVVRGQRNNEAFANGHLSQSMRV